MTEGLFAKHGMRPSMLSAGELARREAARQLMTYLTARGVLYGVEWDLLDEAQRAEWVEAVSKVLQLSFRDITRAVMAELAEYEQKALTFNCEKCRAQEGVKCWDMRSGLEGRHVKHPHKERMDDLAEAEDSA